MRRYTNITQEKYIATSKSFPVTSSRFTSIYKPRLSTLKKKAVPLDKPVSILKKIRIWRQCTEWPDAGLYCLIGTSVRFSWTSNSDSISNSISFFINENILLDLNRLVDSQPSRHKIQKLVTKNAIDLVLLTQESICSNPNMYMLCDNGNKKGNKILAKYICWFDEYK